MNSLSNKWLKNEIWFSLILITSIGLLNYALLIDKLGLYREDWYVIWASIKNGANYLIPMFAGERPFIGYFFNLIIPILGNNPLTWHIFALMIKLLSTYSFFWLMRLLWPENKIAATLAALLFLSYPGFLQQVQPITFHYHLVPLLLAILSISLTIYSTRTEHRVNPIIAIVLSFILGLLYPMFLEYYIGLEGIRLILIWFIYRKEKGLPYRLALKPILYRLVPIYVADALFLSWRVFMFESVRHTTNMGLLLTNYRTNLPFMLARAIIELFRDTFETIILAWFVPVERFLYWGGYPEFVFGVIIASIAIGLIALYYTLVLRNMKSKISDNPVLQVNNSLLWIALGLLMVMVALTPALLSNRDVRFELLTRLDRYTLPASIGTAILLTSLFIHVVKIKYRIGIFMLFIGLATLAHFNYKLYMQDFWQIQRNMWWQLSWRAPDLNDGTLLLVNYPEGFQLIEGYEIWAPVNLIYQNKPGNPPIMAELLDETTLFQILKGEDKARTYRGIRLKRNYNKTLIMSMPSSFDCLNIIDGKKFEFHRDETPLIRELAPHSKIEQIITDVPFATLSASIFGPEPEHDWCFYYQKAMFARQIGDWEQITRLGDETFEKDLSPYDPTEWMPFLEGYASLGRDKEAQQVAAYLKTMNPFGRYTICQQLTAPPDYPNGYDYEKVVELICKVESY